MTLAIYLLCWPKENIQYWPVSNIALKQLRTKIIFMPFLISEFFLNFWFKFQNTDQILDFVKHFVSALDGKKDIHGIQFHVVTCL